MFLILIKLTGILHSVSIAFQECFEGFVFQAQHLRMKEGEGKRSVKPNVNPETRLLAMDSFFNCPCPE